MDFINKNMAKKRAASESSSQGLDKDEQAILEYLVKQNRPYSATDIFNNLHGAVGKTACVRVLNLLAEKGLIHSKTYGKQSVYVARQDTDSAATPEELSILDVQIAEAKKILATKLERNSELQSKLSSLLSSPTDEKLLDSIKQLRDEIEEKRKRLEKLGTGGQLVDPVERTKVLAESESLNKILKSRRRLCMDMVNGIMEGAVDAIGRKTVKEFMQELGCDVEG